MSEALPTNTTPPPVTLLQMMTGYWISQALYIVAKLGVADLLVNGPQPATDLATATQTDGSSLYRLLRALASVGVFSETTPGSFALTPLAALLRTDTPDSMRALAITYNEESTKLGAICSTVSKPDSRPLHIFSAWGLSPTSLNTPKPTVSSTRR
ncbi:MAG: methyltransferase dimerization domain-containing protein [Caldilineaceae bacterium]